MPYIIQELRPDVDKEIDNIVYIVQHEPEHLQNGLMTYILYKLVKNVYGLGDFDKRSDAIKILGCAEHEYYRRVMADYEDVKRQENGDVE